MQKITSVSVTRVWSCSTHGGIGCLHLTLQEKYIVNLLHPSSINSPAQHFLPCTVVPFHRAPLRPIRCYRAEDVADFHLRQLHFRVSTFRLCQPYTPSDHQLAKFSLLYPAGYICRALLSCDSYLVAKLSFLKLLPPFPLLDH